MEDLRRKIEKIISEQIRPSILSHGGDIKVRDIQDGVLNIKLTGQCAGCPISQISTAEWIEETVKNNIDKKDLKVKIYNEVSDDLWNFAKQILKND